MEPITIVRALGNDDLLAVRQLFLEYADTLGFDLEFQSFAEEIADLARAYAEPTGSLLLAVRGSQPAGCVGLRLIDREVCEMKRLYVRPEFRSLGVGRQLAEAVITAAHAAGYRRMRLDTVPGMAAAIALYRLLGFREIPPYRYNPIPGALFMELDLVSVAAASPAASRTSRQDR